MKWLVPLAIWSAEWVLAYRDGAVVLRLISAVAVAFCIVMMWKELFSK